MYRKAAHPFLSRKTYLRWVAGRSNLGEHTFIRLPFFADEGWRNNLPRSSALTPALTMEVSNVPYVERHNRLRKCDPDRKHEQDCEVVTNSRCDGRLDRFGLRV